MPRLFVAIRLPEQVEGLLRGLGQGLPGARWAGESGHHLTLAFLGQVQGPGVEAVDRALQRVSARRFPLALDGLGVFPLRGAPRVLWAGVSVSPELIGLQRSVCARLRRAGVAIESRRYMPHVTLARLAPASGSRLPGFLHAHGDLASPPFEVRSFLLVESVLGREGAVHRPLAAYPLIDPHES